MLYLSNIKKIFIIIFKTYYYCCIVIFTLCFLLISYGLFVKYNSYVELPNNTKLTLELSINDNMKLISKDNKTLLKNIYCIAYDNLYTHGVISNSNDQETYFIHEKNWVKVEEYQSFTLYLNRLYELDIKNKSILYRYNDLNIRI